MSSIGAISCSAQQALASAAAPQKPVASAVASMMRDSDGDHDGTAAGQADPRDAGKGLKLDRMA